MAAESPRKISRYSCNIIRPNPFSDKTVAESVYDFITDVVPQVSQAYGSSSPKGCAEKEKITWIRFLDCDVNDLLANPNLRGIEQKGRPLVVALGYVDGVQIWLVCHSGEAQEVVSLRQGPVTCLRILPTPDPEHDEFKTQRPIAAICDSSSAGKPFCGVEFVSLRTGDSVANVAFKTSPVHNIEANKKYIVVVLQEKLAVFDARRLRRLSWITNCYPCPGINVNPIALGERWLAYADKRLLPVHQSFGGMSGDGSQSYAATVISVAKGAFKGLTTLLGDAMSSKPTPVVKKPEPSPPDENGHRPGIVSVVDLKCLRGERFSVSEDAELDGLIAHFHAHANEPVAAMAFDPSGILLVTACKLGHNFHVFSLVAHPCSSSLGAVHHLYTLHRGDTTAKVTDIAFTYDSRWVTVSTHRGTTHVFPVTPYGGPVCVRTHCLARVVNRVSRFQKSAGLDDIEPGAAGRHSPILSSSPGSSGPQENYPSLIRQNALRNNTGNPRLPPYPHPTPLMPLAQIKQALSIPGLGSASSSSTSLSSQSPSHSTSPKDSGVYHVCSTFSPQRLYASAAMERIDHKKKSAVDSLFVLSQSGMLSEYQLEPKPRQHTGPADKHATSDAPLELEVKGRLQWNLQRPQTTAEVKPPLSANNPLRVATEAVQTQQPTYPAETEPGPVTRYGSKDSISSDHSTGNKDDLDEQWVSQVEIITHVGPHRRLWMGPQFSFKTITNPCATTYLSSSSSSLFSGSPDANAHLSTMDILTDDCDLESLKLNPSRSSPVAMPNARPAYRRSSTSERTTSPGRSSASSLPLYIEAGSYEPSPILSDVFSEWTESNIMRQPQGSEEEEDRLKRTLEDAMMDEPEQTGASPEQDDVVSMRIKEGTL
ncbi:breast carcinoma-amplified sequence 3-like protein [Elysia marginata]|uniref:Breast carcinoma-amplified sequence 3-like protein n=1 Tax=Elysia marginata TaxID=1093978 RepID=A0AAV4GM33_9GAST|nr:breast carcinoma-amplified sequence 3-like protein [Elysia marginata]